MRNNKFTKIIFHLLEKRLINTIKKGIKPKEAEEEIIKIVERSIKDGSLYSMISSWMLRTSLEPIIEINKDRWKIITNNKEFKKDIRLLRKKIPFLNPKKDIVACESPDCRVVYGESRWLASQSKEFREGFDKSISAILNKFDLPYAFYDKIEKYVLYPSYNRKIPVPPMNLCDWSPFDENRQLTTVEKQFLRKILQRRLKVKKGRLPNNKKKALKIKAAKYKIDKILECVSKNQARRKRLIDVALQSIKTKKKLKRYYDEEEERWINNPRLTDADLVDIIFEAKSLSREQIRKRAISFRKQRERYKKYVSQSSKK